MDQTIGLTLGKFAPLHKGHQYLLDTALSEVDRLIVVIYNCPEITEISLNIRAGWIRSLYPQAEVIEAWDGPVEMGDTPEIKKKQEDYILELLEGRKITHFYSSEFYGEHMSKALSAKDRRIDEARRNKPVSGTLLRKDPYKYRSYIDPVVYRDLVKNIVFLGAPSTGKTAIAEQMAKEYNTVWMPEYGREYWEKHQENRRLSLEQLVEIAEGHIEREDKLLLEANNYLFTDTNPITTYIFSMYYHNSAHPRLTELAEKCVTRYDITFLCDTDIPYDNTWDRSGECNRSILQQNILEDLKRRNVLYYILRGKVSSRLNFVKNRLLLER